MILGTDRALEFLRLKLYSPQNEMHSDNGEKRAPDDLRPKIRRGGR